MRRTTLAVFTAIGAILVFSLMLVPLVGATNGVAAPVGQATATAVTATTAATAAATAVATTAATAAATAAATTAPAATAAATRAPAATAAPAATRVPGALPATGGDTGMSVLMLGAAALVILGVAVALLVGRRRDAEL